MLEKGQIEMDEIIYICESACHLSLYRRRGPEDMLDRPGQGLPAGGKAELCLRSLLVTHSFHSGSGARFDRA